MVGDQDNHLYYRINRKDFFKTTSNTIFASIFIMVLIGYYIRLAIINGGNLERLSLFFIPLALFMLPSIILSINYWLISINYKIGMDQLKQVLYVKRKNIIIEYKFDDIDNILHVCGNPNGVTNIGGHPVGRFFFFKLIMKNGEVYIITSFMTDRNFMIYRRSIEVKKTLFPIAIC